MSPSGGAARVQAAAWRCRARTAARRHPGRARRRGSAEEDRWTAQREGVVGQLWPAYDGRVAAGGPDLGQPEDGGGRGSQREHPRRPGAQAAGAGGQQGPERPLPHGQPEPERGRGDGVGEQHQRSLLDHVVDQVGQGAQRRCRPAGPGGVGPGARRAPEPSAWSVAEPAVGCPAAAGRTTSAGTAGPATQRRRGGRPAS